MKLNLEDINKAFESKARLGIMSVLLVNESIDFVSLKNLLELTDGNLALLPPLLPRRIWPAIPGIWRNWGISEATNNLSAVNPTLPFLSPPKEKKLLKNT